MACFSLVMVGYSFFRGDGSSASTAVPDDFMGSEEPDVVGVGLESIYDSIETLELEHQLGNVPDDEYREQLRTYRLEAAAIIRSQLESGRATPELLLEREVIAARTGVARLAVTEEWRSCPQCDAPVPLGDAPCPHCGSLADGGSTSEGAVGSKTALRQ